MCGIDKAESEKNEMVSKAKANSDRLSLEVQEYKGKCAKLEAQSNNLRTKVGQLEERLRRLSVDAKEKRGECKTTLVMNSVPTGTNNARVLKQEKKEGEHEDAATDEGVSDEVKGEESEFTFFAVCDGDEDYYSDGGDGKGAKDDTTSREESAETNGVVARAEGEKGRKGKGRSQAEHRQGGQQQTEEQAKSNRKNRSKRKARGKSGGNASDVLAAEVQEKASATKKKPRRGRRGGGRGSGGKAKVK